MNNRLSLGLRRIRHIASKELIDFIRDWRTLVAVIVIPLLMFPLIFIVLPIVLEMEQTERESQTVNVVIQSNTTAENLFNQFNNSSIAWVLEPLPANSTSDLTNSEDVVERIRDGEIHALLRMKRMNSSLEQWEFVILHDSTHELSNEAKKRILSLIVKWESDIVNSTLLDAGLEPLQALNPVEWRGDISDADIATKAEQAGWTLSLFIPMIVAIWTATSAIQPAIDMTAGERERGTLEPLLTLPCTRFEILTGKWLAVSTIAAVGVLLQIVGLMFAIAFLTANSSMFQFPSISMIAIILMLLSIILFAIMVVAFEIALAIRSRSVKEAGSILGPIILLIFIPAMFAQFVNLESIESFWFAVPIVNILLAMRELFLDRIEVSHVIIWFVTSSIYAIIAAWYASRQFLREDLVESIS